MSRIGGLAGVHDMVKHRFSWQDAPAVDETPAEDQTCATWVLMED